MCRTGWFDMGIYHLQTLELVVFTPGRVLKKLFRAMQRFAGIEETGKLGERFFLTYVYCNAL